MADNSHLKWLDVKEFKPGLWDAGSSYLMPSTAFQTMTDCYPQPEGGLRAFFKPSTTALSTSGISDATNERIIWLAPFVESTGIAYLMLTKHITTGQCKGYTRDIGATVWTLTKTFTAHGDGYANGAVASVCTFHDTGDGTHWVVGISHNKSDGTEDGWWKVTPGGTWTRINATAFAGLGVIEYQARLLGPILNVLWWTDAGENGTPGAANFLTIASGSNDVKDIIVNVIPYSPSQLLVATVGSGWWVVDGDITDPIVRQMSSDHNPWLTQKMAVTETGVVFMEPESGLFITQSMATNFEKIDTAITPHDFDTSQGIGYQNSFLFTPNGRVYDTETGSWFSLSDASTSYNAFEQAAPGINGLDFEKSVLIPQWKASASILSYGLQERNSARAETYTVKTAPLQAGNGRQAVIREIEVAVKSFHASSTVAVTVNGTAQTSAALPVGTNVVRFPFRERGEYLDVQIVPASNTSGYEAPMLEEFRIGLRDDGHTVRFL